jgi:hypothetical protein
MSPSRITTSAARQARLLLLVIGRPHAVDRGELIRVLFDQK